VRIPWIGKVTCHTKLECPLSISRRIFLPQSRVVQLVAQPLDLGTLLTPSEFGLELLSIFTR
jgi:hypothetical protein